MTLEQAFAHFAKTEDFDCIAKQRNSLGGKYRMYLSRFNNGNLKAGAIAEILLANGYSIIAKKARKVA